MFVCDMFMWTICITAGLQGVVTVRAKMWINFVLFVPYIAGSIELLGCAELVFMKTRVDLSLSLASRAIFSSLQILLLSLAVSQYIAVETLTEWE